MRLNYGFDVVSADGDVGGRLRFIEAQGSKSVRLFVAMDADVAGDPDEGDKNPMGVASGEKAVDSGFVDLELFGRVGLQGMYRAEGVRENCNIFVLFMMIIVEEVEES